MLHSALLVLYGMDKTDVGDNANEANHYPEFVRMEEVSNQVYHHERRCHRSNGLTEDDIDKFSPYVPLAIYQSAVVQRMSWTLNGDVFHYDALNVLTSTLETFAQRWANAGDFLHLATTYADC